MKIKYLLLVFFLIAAVTTSIGQCAIPISATPNGQGVNGVSISAPTTVGGVPVGLYQWDFGDGSSTALQTSNSIYHDYVVPGSYTIKVTTTNTSFGQCMDSVIVTVSNPVVGCYASFNVLPYVSPFGFDYTFVGQAAGGIPPYSYLWNTGDTGQTMSTQLPNGGTICLAINDSASGCTATFCDTIFPAFPPFYGAATFSQPTVGCNGIIGINSNFLSDSCGGNLVAYPPGSVDFSSMWQNGDTIFFNTCDSVYSVGVVDSSGTLCSYTIVDSIVSSTSIVEKDKNTFSISPMPNKGAFYIDGDFQSGMQLQIYGLDGKLLHLRTFDESWNNQLFKSYLPQGTYYLLLSNVKSEVLYRKKIIIVK